MEVENNNEEEKLKQLKDEIENLEKAIEKKRELENLERKKQELEKELNKDLYINKIENENIEEKKEDISKKINSKEYEENEDEEIEENIDEETIKKIKNKWIFVGLTAIILSLAGSVFFVNNEKRKNAELLKIQVEEAQREAKLKTEEELKKQMEEKLAIETEKIKKQAEEEAKRNIILNSNVYNSENVPNNENNGTNNNNSVNNEGINNNNSKNTLEIPKIDSKTIDDFNKKAEEAQKNIGNIIEQKDGIVNFYNEMTTKFNDLIKNVETFFNDFFGTEDTKQ